MPCWNGYEHVGQRDGDGPRELGVELVLFDKLQWNGAKVTEEPFKYLHMKAIEVDYGRRMTLGSFNQDHWSFYCNNEANMFINGPKYQKDGMYKAHRQFV